MNPWQLFRLEVSLSLASSTNLRYGLWVCPDAFGTQSVNSYYSLSKWSNACIIPLMFLYHIVELIISRPSLTGCVWGVLIPPGYTGTCSRSLLQPNPLNMLLWCLMVIQRTVRKHTHSMEAFRYCEEAKIVANSKHAWNGRGMTQASMPIGGGPIQLHN